MPWMTAAAIVGGSLVSGAMSANAAGEAADSQKEASGLSLAEQRRQFDLNRSDSAIFRNTGNAAQKRLAVLLGLAPNANAAGMNGPVGTYEHIYVSPDQAHRASQIADRADRYYSDYSGYSTTPQDGLTQVAVRTGDAAPSSAAMTPDAGYGDLTKKFTTADMEADPVYQSGLKFGLDRGTEGINSRALASGMYDSGATLKALTQFGNDYGSTKAGESRNRFVSDQDSIYNRLMGISNGGQASTQQVMSSGTQIAGNISNSMESAGNARAAGIVGGANAWGSGINGAVTGYNNYESNKQLMALLRDRQRGGGTQPGDSWY